LFSHGHAPFFFFILPYEKGAVKKGFPFFHSPFFTKAKELQESAALL